MMKFYLRRAIYVVAAVLVMVWGGFILLSPWTNTPMTTFLSVITGLLLIALPAILMLWHFGYIKLKRKF